MLVVVLSGFILALAVPLLHRLFHNRTGWLLAALPAGLFAYLTPFGYFVPTKILTNGGVVPGDLLGLGLGASAALGAAVLVFARRQIP